MTCFICKNNNIRILGEYPLQKLIQMEVANPELSDLSFDQWVDYKSGFIGLTDQEEEYLFLRGELSIAFRLKHTNKMDIVSDLPCEAHRDLLGSLIERGYVCKKPGNGELFGDSSSHFLYK